jgi:type IV pili sensor histidine kinase/response regulator
MPTPHFLRRQLASGLLVATVVVSGCASIGEPVVARDVPAADITPAPQAPVPELIPVMRSGRYTLAELAPTAAQRDLLLQIVDVVMPEDARATVGDGLRHVLKRSGYQLCSPTSAIADLYELPLPAAHLRLGPMTLRDALLTLAGSAWAVDVDDSKRQVCFSRQGDAPALAAGEQP